MSDAQQRQLEERIAALNAELELRRQMAETFARNAELQRADAEAARARLNGACGEAERSMIESTARAGDNQARLFDEMARQSGARARILEGELDALSQREGVGRESESDRALADAQQRAEEQQRERTGMMNEELAAIHQGMREGAVAHASPEVPGAKTIDIDPITAAAGAAVVIGTVAKDVARVAGEELREAQDDRIDRAEVEQLRERQEERDQTDRESRLRAEIEAEDRRKWQEAAARKIEERYQDDPERKAQELEKLAQEAAKAGRERELEEQRRREERERLERLGQENR
ncbi:MAG: hypothetical protein H6811_00305 [Phycisphaeraceae bacterium]|nr:hypothetical protein [Phycisphaeraceae bacterium]